MLHYKNLRQLVYSSLVSFEVANNGVCLVLRLYYYRNWLVEFFLKPCKGCVQTNLGMQHAISF
jgi:hypothetical protein